MPKHLCSLTGSRGHTCFITNLYLSIKEILRTEERRCRSSYLKLGPRPKRGEHLEQRKEKTRKIKQCAESTLQSWHFGNGKNMTLTLFLFSYQFLLYKSFVSSFNGSAIAKLIYPPSPLCWWTSILVFRLHRVYYAVFQVIITECI